MNKTSPHRPLWLTTSAMLILAVVATVAQRHGSLTGARLTLHNMLSPGRLALLSVSSPGHGREVVRPRLNNDEVADLQNALLQNELQRRQLLIENARLHNELRDMKKLAPLQAVAGRDLVNFVAVKATILSQTGLPTRLRDAIIDAGRDSGLEQSQLVIDHQGLIIDKGTDHGLSAGHKVAHGTSVIGRIATTSRWIGHVQPVTDEDFSGAVQIVRLEQHGAVFGAQGLLEGTGSRLCRITGIPYTESVSVGDEVFSASLEGVQGPRLYYGKVVKADFSAGGQWEIEVEPAFEPANLTEVAVVRQKLDTQRTQVSRSSAEAQRRTQ